MRPRAQEHSNTRPAIEPLTIAALTIAGFLLRVVRVQEYGLNLDEAQFVWVGSCRTLWDVGRYVFAESPHPPGYPFLLHLVSRASTNLFWLRLPSVVAGTFTIWASYRLARELFGRAAGIAMAILVTFSPALIDLSRVCRNYAPGIAIMVLALWLFVRFLPDERWPDLVWFAVLEVIAVLFAYAFVIAFAAANATLAAAFLYRRAPASAWFRAALLQVPVTALVIALYLFHVTKLPPIVVYFHEALYRQRLGFPLNAPLSPLQEVWEYLGPASLAAPLFWLGALGLALLVGTGAWLKALFVVSPLVLAYVAMAAGKLPLGSSRHSTYLFPYLFGLVAAFAARPPEPLARWFHGRWRRPLLLAGALVAAGATGTYVLASVREYSRTVEYVPLARQQRELLTSYRQADIDHAFALLRERADPRDFVMLSTNGVWTVRVQLGTVPLLDPTSAEREARDIRLAPSSPGPLQYASGNVHFYMSPLTGFVFTPESLVRAVRDVRERFGFPEPPRVWVLRTGWEQSLVPQFQLRYPAVPIDLEVHRATNGVLFVVDGAALAGMQVP